MDAAKSGMGGVWFPPLTNVPLAVTPHPSNRRLQQPCLWRAPFPQSVQQYLVSFKHPTGSITNSDLELAGTIASDDILASAVPIAHISTCNLCANTPAVSWRQKGSTTTVGPAAYLLRLSSLHQRHFRYKPEFHHIAGDANAMVVVSGTSVTANYSPILIFIIHRLNPGKCSISGPR